MVQKAIFDLPIGPGQYTEQSERGAVGRWYTMDKVRFRKGLAEKIGGWVRLEPQFLGTARRLKDWTSLDNKRWAAIATDTKLYLWQAPDSLYDITPLRRSVQPLNGGLGPFQTFTGETRVRVTDVAHGAQQGDYVTFSNTIVGGASGITVEGEYLIQTVIDSDTYEIVDDETAAVGGANEGGTNVLAEYQISVGAASAVTATGYGTGGYGAESYGTARTGSTQILGIRTWSLDTWGEDLLACPRGGAIYWWDRSGGTGQRAVALGGDAPPNNQAMLVSQRDRHVLALGAYDYFNDAFDPLLIRWGSTEDLNDWVPSSTNTAGDLRLYSGSEIVTGVRSRLETIIFTDVSVHTLPFLGGFDVFGLNIVGENVSILGPNAAVPIDHRVLFMAESDFYVYDGVVKVLPCDVRNLVYGNLNTVQRDKVYGGLNREFNEVWWFYPSYDIDAWVQQAFDLGLPPGYSLAEASGGGTIGYTYSFNSQGYTEITSTAANGYNYQYVLTNDEPLITPLEAEYAVELDFHPDATNATPYGLVFLRQEITGTPDTNSDDASCIFVELSLLANVIQIRKKQPDGTESALDNSGGSKIVTTLTGSAVTTEQKYIITVQVDTPRIRVWLDEYLAYDFVMSAQELLDYTGGSAGLHCQDAVDTTNEGRFYNFAAGPIGVLTASDFDISPIEVNRYVAFNYEEGTWATGKMARTVWADRSPLLEKPYAAATDGYLYQHETGTDANGVAMPAFIESFDMEIPEAGEYLMHVDQLIPDFLKLEGDVDVYLKGRKYPQAEQQTVKGPYPVSGGTRKISTRIRARQIAIRVESNDTGDRWRFGTWRGRAGPHGKRG